MNTTYARHIAGTTTEEMTTTLLADLSFLANTLAGEEAREYLHLHQLEDGNHIASVIDTQEAWLTLHCLPANQEENWEELISNKATSNLSFNLEYLEAEYASTAKTYIQAAVVTVQDINT